ncbi:class I SAM-dependent methyltransferase [Nocardioides sp. HB32]
MPLEDLHPERDRALSFGVDASAYDRSRSGYPAALLDDLVVVPVIAGLDVGCGTGKVAVELARRRVPVLGVDPDPRMAAVARQHGITVEIGRFEDWDDAGRRFDLITCGHAWHWIGPVAGLEKAARLLEPGGRLARFWNYHVVPADLLTEFRAIYADLAPAATVIGGAPGGVPDAPDPFTSHPAFTASAPRTYRWQRRLTGAQWADLVATFGDHRRLRPEILHRLRSALRESIERHGGIVDVEGGTYVLRARRQ